MGPYDITIIYAIGGDECLLKEDKEVNPVGPLEAGPSLLSNVI
jgi:hypothetical protein